MKQERRVVPQELGVCRIDRAVHQLYEVSWARARAWIESGKISLEGKTVLAPDSQSHPGQELIYAENAPNPKGFYDVHPQQIVWMDRHVVVVEKPAGLLSVPFYEDDKDSFYRRLRLYLSRSTAPAKKKRSALPPLLVVQRLDKDTSGLMVFARTTAGQDGLQEQLRQHTVLRRYAAIVYGEIDSRTIRSHLVKKGGLRGSIEHASNVTKEQAEQGKLAITHVQVEKKYHGATFITCRLETGRTNQIRIHLCEEGHPVLGDAIFRRKYAISAFPVPRLMLHAAELGFIHPVSGEELHFKSALPEEFTELFSNLTPV